jgi:hypothetical protein
MVHFCSQTQVVVACKSIPQEHHAESHYAHLTVASSNLVTQLVK